MPVPDEVRRTQRSLEALGAAHLRATARLDQARAWQSEVLADDVAVAAPHDVVEAAVVDMGGATSLELTAETPGVGAGDGNQGWSPGPAGSSRNPDHRCPAGVLNAPRPEWGANP